MRNLLSAALGGAFAGMVVGLVEALLVVTTAARSTDYWVFPFAALAYGACGLLIGTGCVVGSQWIAPPRSACGRSAAITLFVLGLVIGRYHLVQRVWHEQVDVFSPAAVATQMGLLAAVVVLAALAGTLGRRLDRSRSGLPIAAVGLVAWVALMAVGAATAAPADPNTLFNRQARQTTANTNPSPGRPNVILIVADTLRADALGVYGAGSAATPALDAFARQATRFAHAYSNSTWTRPSVATILTSQYPSQHRARGKVDALPDAATTIAEALSDAGYNTTGIVSNINLAPIFNYQQGFDEYTYLPPDFYFGASDLAARLAIYKGLRVVRERWWRDRIYVQNYYQDAEVVNRTVARWLDRGPAKPFFLFVHYMDPHDPFLEIPYNGHGVARVSTPQPPATSRDELRRLYAQDVAYLDVHLGRMFEDLQQRGLFDNSVIALLADHGEEFHEHGGWWHGATLYDEQSRIPLLIKMAGHTPGNDDRRVVTTIDVAPTLLAAAGVEIPETFVGRDLLAHEEDSDLPSFAEEDFEGNVLRSIRHQGWKLITSNEGNPRGLATLELYNLTLDPAETTNLAEIERERVQALLQRLLEFQSSLASES